MYAGLMTISPGEAGVLHRPRISEPSVTVDDDRILAESVARAGNMFLPVALSEEEKTGAAESAALLRRFALAGPAPDAAAKFKSATLPVAGLLAAARCRK
jgi:hypothetical protein